MSLNESTSSEPISPAGGAAPAAPAAPAALCPVCRAPADDETVQCMHCGAIHHRECWDYNGGCGKYGCASAPPTEKLSDLEVPPSWWGQDEKECPACHGRIQAAALRCRHCGTVFPTTRPQAAAEFHAGRSTKEDLPALRRAVIVLLVFSVVPFTAPLAAVIGGVWYAANRRRLAALPTTQAAMARIALLIAAGVTVLLSVVIALHAALT